MNRFLLLTLAVVGLLLVPYLIWTFQEKTPVKMNDATLTILEENEGLAWLFRYTKFEENSDSHQHLTVLSHSFNRSEWDETVTREGPQLLLLPRVNWFSLEDELLAREVQEYVGISSTGWIVSYFEDLSLSNPLIPDWAKQDQEGYEGSGFIFANELLEETIYVPSKTPFVQGNKNMDESSYSGWLEVTRPGSEGEVSLWFSLPDEIEEEIETLEIPRRFPAILSKQHGNTEAVYMAASLEELESPPAIYQLYGLLTIYKYLYQSRGDSTYWTLFVPSLIPILDHFKESVE